MSKEQKPVCKTCGRSKRIICPRCRDLQTTVEKQHFPCPRCKTTGFVTCPDCPPKPELTRVIKHKRCLVCGNGIGKGAMVYIGCVHAKCAWFEKPKPAKIFKCKHFREYSQSVPMPFGSGNCSEPIGDCAIESESEDCTLDCPDYEEVCQPKPEPSGEFVVELRKLIYVAKHVALFPSMYGVMDGALEAADRIEQLKKEAKANLKMALKYHQQVDELTKRLGLDNPWHNVGDTEQIEQLEAIAQLAHDIHTRDFLYVRDKYKVKYKAEAEELLCDKIEKLRAK